MKKPKKQNSIQWTLTTNNSLALFCAAGSVSHSVSVCWTVPVRVCNECKYGNKELNNPRYAFEHAFIAYARGVYWHFMYIKAEKQTEPLRFHRKNRLMRSEFNAFTYNTRYGAYVQMVNAKPFLMRFITTKIKIK